MAKYEEGKKPIYKKVWFWILVIVIIAVIGTTLGGNGTAQTSSNTFTSTTSQEKFTLNEGHEGHTDELGMSYYIEGSILNNTNKTYNYVQVTFNLYDSDNAQIGTAVANINNLEPNGTWKFKAIGLLSNGVDVASYKLMEITGW